jgi:carbon monoxide dehydrogenase subunit G
MELTNEFTVDVPVERAWTILTDLERIAPCLPGAELREVEGDDYRGVVKVKVGPIATSYQGTAKFTELDEAARRVVLRAEGRETRGQGNANAVVTATMSPVGSQTLVTVVTDLAITGKVAQFGRGVLGDVSSKILEQFVVNLESTVLSSADKPMQATEVKPSESVSGSSDDGAATSSTKSSTEDPKVRIIDSAAAEPVNVVGLAGGSVLRRVWPFAVALVVLAIVVRLSRRH